MWKNQTTYDDAFRWNAVDLYINSGKGAAEVVCESRLGGLLNHYRRAT